MGIVFRVLGLSPRLLRLGELRSLQGVSYLVLGFDFRVLDP